MKRILHTQADPFTFMTKRPRLTGSTAFGGGAAVERRFDAHGSTETMTKALMTLGWTVPHDDESSGDESEPVNSLATLVATAMAVLQNNGVLEEQASAGAEHAGQTMHPKTATRGPAPKGDYCRKRADGRFECTYGDCTKDYKTRQGVKRHRERAHEKKTFQCDEPDCDAMFIGETLLYSHIRKAHNRSGLFAHRKQKPNNQQQSAAESPFL